MAGSSSTTNSFQSGSLLAGADGVGWLGEEKGHGINPWLNAG